MTTFRTALLAAALIAGLAACQQHTAPTTGSSTSTTGIGDGAGDGTGDGLGDSIGRNVDSAMADARSKLATENIKLTENGHHAEITPKGDLIIDGATIPVDATQRQLLLEHRQHIVDIAGAGMKVGAQGARLAGKAVSEAITGIFSGDPGRIEARVQAQAQEIKRSAATLCDQLPAMYESQKRVAAAIPQFAPFATMQPNDTHDCRHDLEDDHASPEASPTAPAAPTGSR